MAEFEFEIISGSYAAQRGWYQLDKRGGRYHMYDGIQLCVFVWLPLDATKHPEEVLSLNPRRSDMFSLWIPVIVVKDLETNKTM